MIRWHEEWFCPECDEPVPGHFDICWNCEAVHPELVASEGDTIDVDGAVLSRES